MVPTLTPGTTPRPQCDLQPNSATFLRSPQLPLLAQGDSAWSGSKYWV